jgi:CheY-like chemotaxis protein
VVDDEPLVARVFKHVLGRDHEVVVVHSGQEARALLEEDDTFDLVITDVMMPGVTGIDLYRWLCEEQPRLAKQVVFVTGGSAKPEIDEFLRAVSNCKLTKPFDWKVLKDLVRGRLERRGPIAGVANAFPRRCPSTSG